MRWKWLFFKTPKIDIYNIFSKSSIRSSYFKLDPDYYTIFKTFLNVGPDLDLFWTVAFLWFFILNNFNLIKIVKIVQRLMYTLHLTSSNVINFHNHRTVIKTRKLTLVQYKYLSCRLCVHFPDFPLRSVFALGYSPVLHVALATTYP